MSTFDENRNKANAELVGILWKLVQENPTQRFSQILRNFEFVKQHKAMAIGRFVWVDEFSLEPTKLLERVQENLTARETP